MPGRSLRRESVTARSRAGWLLFGTLAAASLMTVAADAATPPAYAARASIAPALYYVGDSTGSVYTFTVKNTGTTTSIGAVEIRRPAEGGWTVTSCPTAPAGWTKTASSTRCRYRSAATKTDNLKPGQSAKFAVKAKTAPATTNRTGTWGVTVSSTNHFSTPSALKTAGSMGSGLKTLLHTFEVTGATVATGSPVAGTACPPTNKDAVRDSVVTLVVCGRNHASTALKPTSTYSTLGGTFVAVPGTFVSGSVPANSGIVVLASWVGTEVPDAYGTGKKVIAGIGAARNRTSPIRTFTGYDVISRLPEPVADTATTAEDTPLTVAAPGVLANDTDPDGDALTATGASDPANGSVTLNADGSYTYTPDADFHGTDSFTYRANDGFGDSAATTVTITVTPVADAPVATDDTVSTSEDAATSVPVLGNDTDADGDTLAVTAVDTTGLLGAVTNNGTSVSYDPNGAFEALRPGETATESFTYTVSDGALTDTATVTVTITGVNDLPVAVDDTASTDEDTAVSVNVLANDTDDEGPLTVTAVTAGTGGTPVNNNDGTVTFTPAADFTGTATFGYTVTDLDGATGTATVTITVGGVNDAPVAADDTATLSEDAGDTLFAVLANDTDADGDALTVSGTDVTGVQGVVTNHGTHVSYDPDGKFESLRPGETASESFTYTVSDGNGGTDTATVTITITGVNDLPVAVDDAATTNEDTPAVVNVLANDTDDEGPLTVTSVGNAANGTVTDNGAGNVTYTPNEHFSGSDSFDYTVTDADGATDTATVTITVTPVNDAPVATDDAATLSEDAGDTLFAVLGNDTDADGDALTVSSTDVTGVQGVVTNHGTHVSYDPDGKFETLRPGETATESFTYTVSDGNGGTDTATVTITITGVNDLPVAADDAATTNEDTPVVVNVVANDTDAEGPLTVTSVGNAANGTATDNADGTVTFAPAANFSGTGSFDYTVTDADGATDTATVTITVTPVNDVPVAADDAATVGEDSGGTTVDVLANDTDVEGDPLTVSVTDVTGTTGVVTNNGTGVTYDPNGQFEYLAAGETATDTFTYTVSDGNGGTDTATVTVTVTGANDAPVANDDAYDTLQDTPLVVTAPGVLANDTDADAGDTTTAGNASDPANGTVTLGPDGAFTYTPDTGFTGTDTFTYDASDGTVTDTATVTVTVVPPNATPTADATSASGNEDGGAITVTLTGHDDDGDALTFTAGTATNGLVTVPSGTTCDTNTPSVCTATVTYTPNPNFFGSDSFTYTVNDGTIDSAPATATITVTSVNDAPSFTKGADQTVNEDAAAQSVSGWATGISAGPANESGQTVTFGVTTDNDGLFSSLPLVSPSGTLTYTPAVNANGVATVTVTASDDGGTANGGVATSAPQTFTITVNAVNDAPSFTKGADQSLNEDAGAQSVSNWASAISKGPADESGQTLSFTTSNDNNALFSVQPGVTPTGTLVFTTAPNKYGTATVTITLSDNGGTANGGDDTSDAQTFTITVNAVNDAPVAAAKAYTVQANMKISLGGLLTGATDPNDVAGDPAWTPSFTLGGITAGAGCVGCTISNVDTTNGTFDFDPPAGGSGTYTVTYTVVDDGHPAPGATSAPATITFTVNGPVIWFVDTTASAGGTGRLSAPFNTLPPATTAMGSNAGHRIFVRGGNVSGNVTLPADGWLISEAATGASFDAVMGITPPAGTIARPAVNGTQRTLTGTVTLGTNSVVRGFDIVQTGANKGLVASGKTGLVVNQVSVSTTTGRAVDLANSTGAFTLRRVDSNGADRGISLVNTGLGTFTVTGSGSPGSGGTIANSTGTAVGEAGIHLSNTRDVSLSRITVSSGAGNGIYANGVTNFALDNSTISNNGTNEVNDHSGINGNNVTGTVTLNTVTVFGSREDNARVYNNAGTANITVSNSTFRDNNASVGANGLIVDTTGSAAVTFTGTNNSFLRNHTSGLALFGQSTQRMNVTVTGGTYVTDNGVGLDIETNGPGGMLFSVNGGTVTGCANCAVPVNVYKGTLATGTGANATAGTISGMTVTNGNSLNAPGIWVHGEGPGAARIAVTNNNVSQVGHFGINVSFGNNSASPNLGAQNVDVSVTGNTVNLSGVSGSLAGINVDSGLLSGDTTAMCADIKSNTVTQPIDADVKIRNRMAGTSFRLPGYTGPATDMTAVQGFLIGQNSITDASAFRNSSNAGFAGGAACATP